MLDDMLQPDHPLRALGQLADEDLVALLVAGNQDAMRIIFDRYYAMIMGIALRIVRDVGEAEDVTQTAFTDFYCSAKRFDAQKGSLRTWLLQYAYGRSRNRLAALNVRSHFQHMEFDDVSQKDLAAKAVNACEMFNLTEDEARLFIGQVLGALGEKHRRIVELVCYCGLTIPEVAELTGESVGNIQHYYHRTIEKLRRAFRKLPANEKESGTTKKASPLLQRVRNSAQALAKEVDSVRAQLL